MCPDFLFYAIEENGRDVIELRELSIATTPRPLAESQEGFPGPRLTRLPGGRSKQFLPVCQLLTVQNCSHCRVSTMRLWESGPNWARAYRRGVRCAQAGAKSRPRGARRAAGMRLDRDRQWTDAGERWRFRVVP